MSARGERRRLGWSRLASLAVLLSAAAALVALLLAESQSSRFGWDLRYQYLPAAEAVLEGRDVYAAPDVSAIEAARQYVYPPQLAVALAPFAVLPEPLVIVLALLGSLAALGGSLWVAGVRDVRCYAAVLVWSPTWTALAVLNVTLVLALAVALAWRFRAEARRLALAVGLAASAKLLLWPLLVWLAARGRWRLALLATALGAASMLGAWAVVGFEGLGAYPALLRALADVHAENSYSLVGVAAELGLERPIGQVLSVAVGASLLAACLRFARAGDERRALTCAVVAALALAPIVWQHYLLLLLGPLGAARPRFGWVWLLPVLLWASPHEWNGSGVQPLLPALVVAALTAALLVRPRPAPLLAETT